MSELARPFRMALPSFSQHLDVLEGCDSSGRARRGACDVPAAPAPLKAAEAWMTTRRALWECRLDQLDAYLDELAHGG